MAVLINHSARLLVGLTVKGHPVPRWLPGRNPLDPEYWAQVKDSAVMKSWRSGRSPMISVDLDGSMPDPDKPPSAEELASFSLDDLRKAIKDPEVPVQWHPILEAELSRREAAKITKRLPKTPASRASVTGLRVEDALPLIEAETDIGKLVDWADADKRKTINEAIDKRLAELDSDGG